MELESEYSESSSITFDWTLRGLKSLFDSTKGDKKSKVTKSIRFGGNRWQVSTYCRRPLLPNTKNHGLDPVLR